MRRPRHLVLLACVLGLIGMQAWYSSLTTSRIFYEELAEGVRNPLWLTHRLVYDGMSSNIGWYGLLAAVYETFGFSFLAGKAVRLCLQALALASLGHLFLRWLGWRHAIVPLVVIGSSPAILYFNTLLTTYGVDLQWAPILAWLVWQSTEAPGRGLAAHALLGLTATVACLMWPVCLFYMPALVLAYWRRAPVDRRAVRVMTLAASAITPILIAAVWLRNVSTWIHDPAVASGIFRGGGGGLVDSPRAFFANSWWVATDVTTSGTSYYFWLPVPDLSGLLGLLPAVTVVAMLPSLWRSADAIRGVVGWSMALALGATAMTSLAAGPPGFRRATAALAVFYVLYALCWQHATTAARRDPQAWRPRLQVALLALLLVHHLAAFVPNGRSLVADRPAEERHWFAIKDTPQESVDYWAGRVSHRSPLDCRDVALAGDSCRYAEVYAAVVFQLGSRTVIRAYDAGTGEYVTLKPDDWPSRLSR